MVTANGDCLPPRFMTDDMETFCHFYARNLWPKIVQNAVDEMTRELSTLDDDDESFFQGAIIKQGLIDIRRELDSDTELRNFTQDEIKRADVPSSFNEYLDCQFPRFTWGRTEWLFGGAYLYRRINVLFRMHSQWNEFDIFNSAKQSSFRDSYHGVLELAMRYCSILPQMEKLDRAKEDDQKVLYLLFKEFIQISLWGNATDLSLLTNATLEDLKSIQGASAREAAQCNIVIDDTEQAFLHLLQAHTDHESQGVRVDFVLDNSGFELYADLILASFLLQTGLVDKCVFHTKDIPFMVSDATLNDFDTMVSGLLDKDFFPFGSSSTASPQSLTLFARDIQMLNKTGKLTPKADSFWTSDLDYWNIDPSGAKYRGDEIYEELSKSDLVIFKGDLNYRRLTGDREWKRTTPWTTSIGPLATNGISTLSLRTCKADVQVGLQPGQDEMLSTEWRKENQGGKGSWWSSSGKWAVICFCDGH